MGSEGDLSLMAPAAAASSAAGKCMGFRLNRTRGETTDPGGAGPSFAVS